MAFSLKFIGGDHIRLLRKNLRGLKYKQTTVEDESSHCRFLRALQGYLRSIESCITLRESDLNKSSHMGKLLGQNRREGCTSIALEPE